MTTSLSVTWTKTDNFLLFQLLSLLVLVRLYRIYSPSNVVFDEVHFGGIVNKYWSGEFFVDIHPPLAKLVFYTVACLFGYDGEFDFARIGEDIPSSVPIIAMRMVLGLCGVFLVALTYMTLKYSCCRPLISFVGSLLVLIENSLVTQLRLVLLDAPIILGCALAAYGLQASHIRSKDCNLWLKYMAIAGIGCGIAISSKALGVLTLGWILVVTMIDMWVELGDRLITDKQWWARLGSRACTLVILPITLYLAVFAIHLKCLPYVGTGFGSVLPEFQAQFMDSLTLDTPSRVSFGSDISIKHNGLNEYLHSHPFDYETGSQQQQVTLYGFGSQDENNHWILEGTLKVRPGQLQQKIDFVKNGDRIRLFHQGTGRFLTVNDVRPPSCEHDYSNEVSCHQLREELLANIDYEWKVEIVGTRGPDDLGLTELRAGESIFRLKHEGTKCHLLAHNVPLPKWGFGQLEVVCINEPTLPNTLFYIEGNSHPLLDSDSHHERIRLKKIGFLAKVWDYHLAMFRANQQIPKEHASALRPQQWPLTLSGVAYYTQQWIPTLEDGIDGFNIYFLGNLAVYVIGVMVIAFAAVKIGFGAIVALNPFSTSYVSPTQSVFYRNGLAWLLGWFIHYYPYFSMDRQLFLHHYLLSLFFSILLIAQTLELITSRYRKLGYVILGAILLALVYCFYIQMPLIYGLSWTREECVKLKWLNWDYDCMAYS